MLSVSVKTFGSLSAVVGSDHRSPRASQRRTLLLVSRSPARLTFQMLPEAVGLQTRFSPDGVERKVFVTGRHHMAETSLL